MFKESLLVGLSLQEKRVTAAVSFFRRCRNVFWEAVNHFIKKKKDFSSDHNYILTKKLRKWDFLFLVDQWLYPSNSS